jgi:hypothetical protein
MCTVRGEVGGSWLLIEQPSRQPSKNGVSSVPEALIMKKSTLFCHWLILTACGDPKGDDRVRKYWFSRYDVRPLILPLLIRHVGGTQIMSSFDWL